MPCALCPETASKEKMSEKKRQKVYLETSFISYLTGRATTREPIASWQAASRQWWEAVRPSCDLFVSEHVLNEIRKGSQNDVAKRDEAICGIPALSGLDSPVIITPKRYMEDICHDN